MTRAPAVIVGGTLVALFAASFSPLSAHAETFDARWIALQDSKQDRLAPPRKVADAEVTAITDSASRTTTIVKRENAASQSQRLPVRDVPRDSARKEKLPVGCDPSFSPVTTPQMAHVTGRCIAERPTGNKFAQLSR